MTSSPPQFEASQPTSHAEHMSRLRRKCDCGEEDCEDCKNRLSCQRSAARAAGDPDAEPERKRGPKPKCECGDENCEDCKPRLRMQRYRAKKAAGV